MFLRQLNDNQKTLFLNLAKEAAKSNGIVNNNEKRLIEAYADEMGINSDVTSSLSVEKICLDLKDISSKKELNQMCFEIASLLLGDMDFDSDEHSFLAKVCSIWEIDSSKCDEMLTYINEYIEWMRKVNILLFD